MRRFLVAAVMCGSVTAANAADLPILRGGFADGLTTSRPNWDGFYVGGQGGWGSIQSGSLAGLNSDLIANVDAWRGGNYSWGELGRAHGSSASVGAFAGYNSQWDDVVIGIEANYIHANLNANSTAAANTIDTTSRLTTATTVSSATVNISDFGSVRLRAGYAADCFLPYAFIGAGVGDQTVYRSVSAFPGPTLSVPQTASNTKLVYGYSAGVGFDVMLVAGFFLRAEYEYQRVTSNIESNINSVRAGLGYKF